MTCVTKSCSEQTLSVRLRPSQISGDKLQAESPMKNLAEEIPQRAFINAQVIQLLHDSAPFQEAVSAVSGHYGLRNYEFMNPAYVVSLLYCLLVVPRQLFVEGAEEVWNSQVPASAMSSYFVVNRDDQRVIESSSAFLRRLRNSVSHARFEIGEDLQFVFRDINIRKHPRKVDFEVEASAANLMRFLSDIGSKLANLRPSYGSVQ